MRDASECININEYTCLSFSTHFQVLVKLCLLYECMGILMCMLMNT